MKENKLKIISKIRVNGELYRQEELDPKEFRSLVDKKIDEVMKNMGFERDTA